MTAPQPTLVLYTLTVTARETLRDEVLPDKPF